MLRQRWRRDEKGDQRTGDGIQRKMLGITRLHNRPEFRLPQHLIFVKAELVLDPEFDSRMPSDNVGPRLGRHPAKA